MTGNVSSAGKSRKKTGRGKSPKDLLAELKKVKTALRKERELAKHAKAKINEALEIQAATNEILRVIAASPTDIQPVFDVIVESARRLCNASMSAVYRTDGETVYEVASSDVSADLLETEREVSSQSYPAPLRWDSTLSSRAILSRDIVHIPDMEHAPDLPEITRRFVKLKILKSVLHVPMTREGESIGAIGIGKRDPAPFSETQIELMKTFASQAVIAIENVRLFNELQTRNAEITENLEYQTAISEIMRVITASPTDIQPVLDAISENALKLCGANFSAVYNYDGKMLDMTALKNFTPKATEEIRREYPRPLTRDGGYSARSILEGKVIHVVDALNDPDIPEATKPLVASLGFRSGLWVPMLREGNPVGAFCVARPEAGAFDEKKILLLQTFADQATIAIENVRLFTETQRLLKETKQRAAELAIISSVQEGLASKLEVQAIYDLVGDKIRDIFQASGTAIYLFDHERETQYTPYCFLKQRFDIEPHPYSGIAKTMLDTLRPRMYCSVKEYRAIGGQVLESGEEFKSGMNVPLMVGNEITGMIHIANLDKENAYTDSDLRLLTTLANSMSVALENARLWEQEKMFRKALQRELEIGREIQAGFLPEMLPRIAGWEISATLMSAREVAGDFYDAFKLPDGTIGLVIADVCDKGVGAALFMTLFRSLIRAVANLDYFEQSEASAYQSTEERLQRAMSLANNYINETHIKSGMFATVFFGILDPRDGRFVYINGGHESPFIFRAENAFEFLHKTGPAVGMIQKFQFKILETQLQAGDMFFAFTDGVPDCRNSLGEFFGRERLSELVQRKESAHNTVDTIAASLRQYIGGANQLDDITLLAVRRSQ